MKKLLLLCITLPFIFLSCVSFNPVVIHPSEKNILVNKDRDSLFSATKIFLHDYINSEATLFQSPRKPELTTLGIDKKQKIIKGNVDLGKYFSDKDLLFTEIVALHAIADLTFSFQDGKAKINVHGINTVVDICKNNCPYENSNGIDSPYVSEVKDYLKDFTNGYAQYLANN